MARAYRRLIIPVIGLKCPVKVMGANPYLATSLTKPVKGRGSMQEECGEYKHCWHQVGDKCRELVKYEGLKVYILRMCCVCFKHERHLEWD